MELLVKKKNVEDSGVIDSTTLLKDFIDTTTLNNILDRYVHEDTLNKVLMEDKDVTKEEILKLLLDKGIISLNFPLMLNSVAIVDKLPPGCILYNPVTDEWILTKKGKNVIL